MDRIKWLIVVIVAIIVIAGLKCSEFNSNSNLLLVALTTVFLLFYMIDNHKIACATEEGLLEAKRPQIGFEIEAKSAGPDFHTFVRVINHSNFFCNVFVSLNMRIYGQTIKHSPKYDGEEPWLLLPKQITGGWFSINELLNKVGKNLQEVAVDKSYEQSNKITIDLTIRAKGITGGETNYPSLHWYFQISPKVAWIYMS